MKKINPVALVAHCNKQTSTALTTSRDLRLKKAFVRLWTLLQNHYEHQGFNKKLGLSDGDTAALWFFEFKKNGIGFDEIVLIGNNLGELTRPEFIPNVFQLINLAKRLKKQADEQYKIHTQQHFLSPNEIAELRDKTKRIRIKSIEEIQKILTQGTTIHVQRIPGNIKKTNCLG